MQMFWLAVDVGAVTCVCGLSLRENASSGGEPWGVELLEFASQVRTLHLLVREARWPRGNVKADAKAPPSKLLLACKGAPKSRREATRASLGDDGGTSEDGAEFPALLPFLVIETEGVVHAWEEAVRPQGLEGPEVASFDALVCAEDCEAAPPERVQPPLAMRGQGGITPGVATSCAARGVARFYSCRSAHRSAEVVGVNGVLAEGGGEHDAWALALRRGDAEDPLLARQGDSPPCEVWRAGVGGSVDELCETLAIGVFVLGAR
ncbi:hypothetical protein ACSSS7_008432 [Eimeria intestinalis]